MPTDLSFLGIGPLELLALLVLVLILFNPRDIANGAKNVGRFINRVTRSNNFKLIQQTSREIQEENLPARLAQEAELDDLKKTGETLKQDINTVGQQIRGATTEAAQQTAEAVKDAGQTAKQNLADNNPPTTNADPYGPGRPRARTSRPDRNRALRSARPLTRHPLTNAPNGGREASGGGSPYPDCCGRSSHGRFGSSGTAPNKCVAFSQRIPRKYR